MITLFMDLTDQIFTVITFLSQAAALTAAGGLYTLFSRADGPMVSPLRLVFGAVALLIAWDGLGSLATMLGYTDRGASLAVLGARWVFVPYICLAAALGYLLFKLSRDDGGAIRD